MENVENCEHSKPVSVECGVRGQTPNPGSDAAVDMGCTCPRMDNGYGVLDAIEEYFSDTSRSAEETRAGLEAIREHLGILIDTLPEPDMDYEG